MATSWHSNKFLNPITDGAVLPILHLNGYKIAGPTVLARIPHEELDALMRGYGWSPRYVEGDEPADMHRKMAAARGECIEEIARIQRDARSRREVRRPRWPMIVLRSPKGWTGPKQIDGVPIEGTYRAHQVPFEIGHDPQRLATLEQWMKSYRPEELFDARGRLVESLAALPPKGDRRMGANPHANGGLLRKELRMPDFTAYAVDVPAPAPAPAHGRQAGRARPVHPRARRRHARGARLEVAGLTGARSRALHVANYTSGRRCRRRRRPDFTNLHAPGPRAASTRAHRSW